MNKNNSRKQIALGGFFIVIATLLWATDLFCRYDLLKVLDPVSLVWLEHLIVLILLAPFFLTCLAKLFKLNRKYFFSLMFIGIGGSAIGTVAFSFAFGTINPVIPIVLQKLQPFVAITGAHLILHERHPKYFLIAAAVAIIGAVMLSHPYLLDFATCMRNLPECLLPHSSEAENASPQWLSGLAVASALVAVVAWGMSTVFGRLVSQKLDAKDITFLRYFFGFCGLFFWMSLIGSNEKLFGFAEIVMQQPELGFKLVYMAIVIGLIALVFYYKGLQRVPAKLATLLELFYPVFALILAYIFLGQTMNAFQVIGMALIVSSSLYCTQRGFK